MSDASKVEAIDVQGYGGTNSCTAGGRGNAARAGSAELSQLQSKTRQKCVPVGFLNIIQDVFVRSIAAGILNSRVHPGEYAQIIQLLLYVRLFNRRKRIAGVQCHSLIQQLRACMMQ